MRYAQGLGLHATGGYGSEPQTGKWHTLCGAAQSLHPAGKHSQTHISIPRWDSPSDIWPVIGYVGPQTVYDRGHPVGTVLDSSTADAMHGTGFTRKSGTSTADAILVSPHVTLDRKRPIWRCTQPPEVSTRDTTDRKRSMWVCTEPRGTKGNPPNW